MSCKRAKQQNLWWQQQHGLFFSLCLQQSSRRAAFSSGGDDCSCFRVHRRVGQNEAPNKANLQSARGTLFERYTSARLARAENTHISRVYDPTTRDDYERDVMLERRNGDTRRLSEDAAGTTIKNAARAAAVPSTSSSSRTKTPLQRRRRRSTAAAAMSEKRASSACSLPAVFGRHIEPLPSRDRFTRPPLIPQPRLCRLRSGGGGGGDNAAVPNSVGAAVGVAPRSPSAASIADAYAASSPAISNGGSDSACSG